MFAGGMKYERQKFNQTAAGMGASLLLLAAVGLIIPALFHFTAADRGVTIERELSLTISFVLFAIYVASLLFSLKTHRHLFVGESIMPRTSESSLGPVALRLRCSPWWPFSWP